MNANDTTLEGLRDAINTQAPNVTATINVKGRLELRAADGYMSVGEHVPDFTIERLGELTDVLEILENEYS